MIQLKKTILTLVALIAVTTGAWAQSSLSVVELEVPAAWANDNSNMTAADLPGFKAVTVEEGQAWTGAPAEGVAYLFYDFDGADVKYISFEKGKYTGYAVQPLPKNVIFGAKFYYTTGPASSASAVEVDWNKTSKTGTFNMPGGNVTLAPEYYPQATAAEGAVTAATDAKATTEDALVTVDETKLTGVAKMMYYVSTSTTAPAYDAEGWTDVLPTAANYIEAGNVNVWYYPVGTDEGVGGATATYSDGDMNATALTVTIAAAPTYAVTFAEGIDEPTKWSASPNTGVKKGTPVTVTYTGTKRVKGVKAVKKAAGPVTYTELKGGEVLHVGDILSDANVKYLFTDFNLLPHNCPFTVIRANITGDEEDPIVTPADDGTYYVIQDKNGNYYFTYKNLPVTATSDGILITITSENGNYRECTVSVHEP